VSVPHLRDIPIPRLADELRRAGFERPEAKTHLLALAVHRRGALEWDDVRVGFGRRTGTHLRARFRLGPQLADAGVRTDADGTRKFMYRLPDASPVEVVFIRNRGNRTLCLSSQAGCALACTFCATGELGLIRNMTAGEITESLVRVQGATGERATDVVFMGMGEPLHNYDAVMDACENLNHDLGHTIARKRITVSTAGLVPQIRRFTAERRPWRLNLSLHSAVQETRARLMPIARVHPLPELIDAMRQHQRACDVKWLTFQYVAIPGVNMDAEHVEALARELRGLRYILNVIPWNETGAAFRPPSWTEVKEFTTRLRALRCPVKTRYSAGKRSGMGCGQLAAETVATVPTGGHMLAPPGIFTA
jgi:23S rRNA (adenine2503-C2)-methyltransferase